MFYCKIKNISRSFTKLRDMFASYASHVKKLFYLILKYRSLEEVLSFMICIVHKIAHNIYNTG